MPLSKNSLFLVNLSIYSLFMLVLFKPSEKLQGIYTWMIRPEYVNQILKLIFFPSIIIFLFISTILILKNIRNINFNKNYLILNFLFLTSVLFIQMIDYIQEGQSLENFIFKTLLFIIYFLIFNFYTQLNKDIIFYLLPISIPSSFFILFNMSLLIIDPNAVWPESSYARMFGTTEHPNFFAIICAIAFIANLQTYKNINKLFSKRIQYLKYYFLLISFLSILGILFSGSRTGLLFILIYLFIISFNFKSYSYLKVVYLLLSFCILIFLLFNIDIFLNIEGSRITSTQNNRSEAWDNMFHIFLNNPFLGIGLHNVSFSENSYLRIMAASGIVGSLFFFIFVIKVILKSLINLNVTNLKNFSYLLIPMYITANVEAFLTDVLTFPIVTFLYAISCIYNIKGVNQ